MSPEALSGGTSNRVARVRWFYNDWFFLSLYFLSLLFKIHAGPTKIKSYTLIFFISIVVLIFLIALYLFWIFFHSLSFGPIWILYQIWFTFFWLLFLLYIYIYIYIYILLIKFVFQFHPSSFYVILFLY
jgi:hypothetical protein